MENRKQLDILSSIRKTLAHVNWRAWLPSRGSVVFTLVLVLALFWAQSVNALPWMGNPATSSTSISTWPYQGRLADSAGNPITATVPMIFRLYASAEGGVPLWEENWAGPNSVEVSDGLFNIMLGSLTPIPHSLVTNNSSLWLGITAGTDDEMEPRVQIGSVPISYMALEVPDASIGTEKLEDGAVTQAKLGADISLVPPDGSITSAQITDETVAMVDLANGAVTRQKLGDDVSIIQIQSGSVYGSTSTPGWPLASGSTGEKYYVAHVTFTDSFASIPTVFVAFSRQDIESTYNTRVEVYAENLTTSGFDLVMHKWSTTIVYSITASWIAYGNQ